MVAAEDEYVEDVNAKINIAWIKWGEWLPVSLATKVKDNLF